MFFCLSIITILLDSLLVLPYKKGCFLLFLLFSESRNAKTTPASIAETGAVRLLYLCFFKRSRNYLRGFLIAAWAGAKITGRREWRWYVISPLVSSAGTPAICSRSPVCQNIPHFPAASAAAPRPSALPFVRPVPPHPDNGRSEPHPAFRP